MAKTTKKNSDEEPQDPPIGLSEAARISEQAFRSLYQQQPVLVAAFPLIELGRRYHQMCDDFDDKNLTGPVGRDGSRMPANGEEARLMLVHSRIVRGMLVDEAAELGCTLRELQDAISEASRERRRR